MGSALKEPAGPGFPTPAFRNRSLHRFAVVLAICTLPLVVLGALLTLVERNSASSSLPLLQTHQVAATAAGLLAFVETIWLGRADPRRWVRNLGAIAVVSVILQGVLGAFPILGSKTSGILHASLAQLFCALAVAIAIFTSDSWLRGPHLVFDSGWPSLSSLSITTAALLLMQGVFGAAFRHRVVGPIPHIAGAAAITTVVLIVCIFVLSQHSSHESLRQSAMALLVLTLAQLFLGTAAYMARLSAVPASVATGPVVLLSGIHAAAGALTLAAGVALAIQVSRNVRRPAAMALSSPRSVGTAWRHS